MEVIADRIRAERERNGWDQAELARRIGGVTQQTVSRSERGGSRPRREMVARMAETFEAPARDLLIAAGYAAAADHRRVSPQPVHPRLVNLPFDQLASDQFEHFVADLAQMLFPEEQVSRFGTQGHKQHGIDILVQDGPSARATFQCKRHRQFGAQKVSAAVAAVTISAQDHYLALARVASPGARREMARHAGWTLLDVEDLSRLVRTHQSHDRAVRLVDSHFPGWREPLLGVSEPGVWQTTEEFYRLSSRGDFYSHNWSLVGRGVTRDEAAVFAETAGPGVGLLVGRGGIGKTRLLRAIAEASLANGVDVRFLEAASSVQPQQFEILPGSDKSLVIIDDVHERTDVAELMSGIWRARPNTRILLALRPYGLSPLSAQLRHLGLHATDLPKWKLRDLSVLEAETLAREVLGEPTALTGALVQRLAHLTTDCPLVTVVGAILIKRGLLDVHRLENDDEIRDEILLAFRDALVADPIDGDRAVRRAVLDALALLQPFRIDDEDFRSAFSALIGAPFDRAISHLRALEDAGVLLRRGGRSLRIVPDLLGDIVLAGAAFDQASGASTGYIERARATASGAALQHIFLNASRVDWQVRRQHGTTAKLADALWADVETALRNTGTRDRLALLGLLGKVAFYQPDKALSLVRWTIDNTSGAIDEHDEPLMRLYPRSYDELLRALPPILKAVAYNFDHFAPAVDLLWELGRADRRPTNQYPDHAIRVLQDLASYSPGKAVPYHTAMIDAAERWLTEDSICAWAHSPFDVLEQLLATEGSEHISDGWTVALRPFAINAEATVELRQHVIDVAFREATGADLRRSNRAVVALESALRYPSGLFGRPVTGDEKASWRPSFIGLIERLGVLASEPGIDPVLAVSVRKALRWHAGYSNDETKAIAERAVSRIPTSLPFELAVVLHDGWGDLAEGHWTDYKAMQATKQARLERIAERLIREVSDEDAALALICDRLRAEEVAFNRSPAGTPGPFCYTLFSKRPSLAARVCDRVVADPGDKFLVQVLSIAISRLGFTDTERLIPTIDGLLGIGSIEVRRAVGLGLGIHRDGRPLVHDEFDRLRRFGADSDVSLRMSAVQAARQIAGSSVARGTRTCMFCPLF